jgi:hypothetical protein
LQNFQKRYSACKRLKGKIHTYFLVIANNRSQARRNDDTDSEDDTDPDLADLLPNLLNLRILHHKLEHQPAADPIKELTNDLNCLSVAMAIHNLLLHLPWIQSTTNYLPNGNKEFVFNFLALSIGVSKYHFKVSDDGMKITYFMYFPNKYVDPIRNAHTGCKYMLAGAIGDICREIPYLEARVPTKSVTIDLPFKCKIRIKSLELIMDLETHPKLYDLLVNNCEVPKHVEYQVPLILCTVLLGQKKCHASLVGRGTRVTNAAFLPPVGARAQRTPAPPAYTADYAAFQAWQRAQASGQGSTQKRSNTTNRTPPSHDYWDQFMHPSSDTSECTRWYQQQDDQRCQDREMHAEDWDAFHIDPNAADPLYNDLDDL